MKKQYGKNMKYNTIMILAILITSFFSLSIAYLLCNYFVSQYTFYKMFQLILTILLMTTFYAPIKHILLKNMKIKGDDNE